MGFWRALTRGRIREDRGAYAILFAIMTVALLTIVALVVDLGQTRAVARANQTVADLALLGGGPKMNNPQAACRSAWTYLVANLDAGLPASPVPDPCSKYPTSNLAGATYQDGTALPAVCSQTTGPYDESGLPSRTERVSTYTLSPFTIFYVYPVIETDPEMTSSFGGTGLRTIDGNPCQRMGLVVRRNLASLFGGIVGSSGTSAVASAVMRGPTPGNTKVPAALIILDPQSCRTLTVSGQGTIDLKPVGSTPGIIAVDSGPTSTCSNAASDYVMHVDGGANALGRIMAEGITGGANGVIEMFNIGAASCSTTGQPNNQKACDISNFPTQISPAPVTEDSQVTPSPWWYRYDCKTGYPSFHGELIADCAGVIDPTTGVLVAPTGSQYITNLINQVGSSQSKATVEALGFKDYLTDNDVRDTSANHNTLPKTAAARCGPTQDVLVGINKVGNTWTPYSANWFIDCPNPNNSTQGFNPSGHSVTFYQGNLVFTGGINVSQSSGLNINCPLAGSCDPVANTSSAGSYPGSCTTSDLGATCLGANTAGASWVYLRSSNGGTQFMNSGNNATAYLHYSTVYIEDKSGGQGSLQWGSGSGTVLHWVAPIEGPFRNLALWSQGSTQQTLGGAASLAMEGIFFTPQATPFQFQGQGAFTQTKAQFVAFRMDMSGQGTLVMAPDPTRIEHIPFSGALLIR